MIIGNAVTLEATSVKHRLCCQL